MSLEQGTAGAAGGSQGGNGKSESIEEAVPARNVFGF